VGDYKIQYYCKGDGCTYCWDELNNKWLKVCPADCIPDDVKCQVLEKKELFSDIEV